MKHEVKEGTVKLFFEEMDGDLVTEIKQNAPAKYRNMNNKVFINEMAKKPERLPLGIQILLSEGDVHGALELFKGKVFKIN